MRMSLRMTLAGSSTRISRAFIASTRRNRRSGGLYDSWGPQTVPGEGVQYRYVQFHGFWFGVCVLDPPSFGYIPETLFGSGERTKQYVQSTGRSLK